MLGGAVSSGAGFTCMSLFQALKDCFDALHSPRLFRGLFLIVSTMKQCAASLSARRTALREFRSGLLAAHIGNVHGNVITWPRSRARRKRPSKKPRRN